MATNQKPTGFMDLPAEIRIMIYKEYLVNSLDIWIYYEGQRPCMDIGHKQPRTKSRLVSCFTLSKRFSNKPFISLFLCNSTIHQEASSIFYRENEFTFPVSPRDRGWGCLYKWLTKIGPRNRSFLTKISIHYNYLQYQVWDKDWTMQKTFEAYLWSYPASSYLNIPRSPKGRLVEVIDSNIQRAFDLLTSREDDGLKLMVMMKLPEHFEHPLPLRVAEDDSDSDGSDGSSESSDDYDGDDYYGDDSDEDNYDDEDSNEDSDEDDSDQEDSDSDFDEEWEWSNISCLPHSLEEFRKLNEANLVSVHWESHEKVDRLEELKGRLEANGWEILSTGVPQSHLKCPTVPITVRRKENPQLQG